MRRNHRAIKAKAPFNVFPVSSTVHCLSSVAFALYSVFQKLPFGNTSRNKINPLIIWFQQICFNKAAPYSSQVWWMAACKHKRSTGIVFDAALMKCYPPPAPRSRPTECARSTVWKHSKAKQKRSIGFCLTSNIYAWLGSVTLSLAISEMRHDRERMLPARLLILFKK